MSYDFKTIKVKLSKTHITKGKKLFVDKCPMALAINDIIPFPGFNATVHTIYCCIRDDSGNIKYQASMPKVAEMFVRKFDNCPTEKERSKFKPFNFQLTFKAVKY